MIRRRLHGRYNRYEDSGGYVKASNIAGKAIAITGTSLPHALSYRLTFEANVAHGPATGIFQPGFISHADEKTQKELFRAMDFRGLEDFKEFLEEAVISVR